MQNIWKVLKENLWTNNPVIVQILGICSTLAVTNNVKNTFIMSVALMLVTALSSFALSSIKNLIPRKVRMIVQVLVISFFVIIVDMILKAYLPDISKALGPYVGLIITNCIIMGRAEAFAQSNPPLISMWDGFTSGAGYAMILLSISIVRELLGFGTIFNFQVLPSGFMPWTIMIMPPSGFIMITLVLWFTRSLTLNKEVKK
jgi:Na+-transporting NADH:ubiquinone oxidoreductase subunit D